MMMIMMVGRGWSWIGITHDDDGDDDDDGGDYDDYDGD
jgi:hypothetical protein